MSIDPEQLHETFQKHSLNDKVAAVAPWYVTIFWPRQWRRWFFGNIGLTILLLLTIQNNGDPQSETNYANGDKFHFTALSWVVFVVLVVSVVFGWLHCHKVSRRQHAQGVTLAESSPWQRMRHQVVADPIVDDVEPEVAPAAPVERPVAQHTVKVIEEHDGYIVVDRRAVRPEDV